VSTRSPNRIRKVGVVLVLHDGTEITACNSFPAGIRDIEERHAGDGRFVWMEHAERRAIFEAALTTDPDARLYRKGKGKEAKSMFPARLVPLILGGQRCGR
jgi:hypothetical protein